MAFNSENGLGNVDWNNTTPSLFAQFFVSLIASTIPFGLEVGGRLRNFLRQQVSNVPYLEHYMPISLLMYVSFFRFQCLSGFRIGVEE